MVHETRRELISKVQRRGGGHAEEILSGSRGLVLISPNGGGEERRMTRGSRGYDKRRRRGSGGGQSSEVCDLKSWLRCSVVVAVAEGGEGGARRKRRERRTEAEI